MCWALHPSSKDMVPICPIAENTDVTVTTAVVMLSYTRIVTQLDVSHCVANVTKLLTSSLMSDLFHLRKTAQDLFLCTRIVSSVSQQSPEKCMCQKTPGLT